MTMVQFRTALFDSFVTGTRELSVAFAVLVVMSTAVRFSDAQMCTSAQDCGGKENGYQCCSGLCVQGSSCLGQDCKINHDCSTSEVCCNKKCVNNWNCLGQTCSLGDDCQWNESCCYGSCRRSHECVNMTVVAIIFAVALIAFVSLLACLFRKITSIKQWSSFQSSQSEVTSCTTLLNDTGNLPSSGGSSSDVPQKFPSHSTVQIFCTPAGDDLHLPETPEKERKGSNPTAMAFYGSICETIQP